MFKINQNQ